MAVLHLPSDDPRTAGEDPLRLGRVVLDLVLGVHEGDVHGEAGEDEVQLFRIEATGGQPQGGLAPAGTGRRGFAQRTCRGLPAGLGFYEGIPDLLAALENPSPLGL